MLQPRQLNAIILQLQRKLAALGGQTSAMPGLGMAPDSPLMPAPASSPALAPASLSPRPLLTGLTRGGGARHSARATTAQRMGRALPRIESPARTASAAYMGAARSIPAPKLNPISFGRVKGTAGRPTYNGAQL